MLCDFLSFPQHTHTHMYVCCAIVMALEMFVCSGDRASLFRTAGPNVIGKELWLRPFSELKITFELRRSNGGGAESLSTTPHCLFHFKGMFQVQYWFMLSITTVNHWLVTQFVKTQRNRIHHYCHIILSSSDEKCVYVNIMYVCMYNIYIIYIYYIYIYIYIHTIYIHTHKKKEKQWEPGISMFFFFLCLIDMNKLFWKTCLVFMLYVDYHFTNNKHTFA